MININIPRSESFDEPDSWALGAHEHFHVWNGRLFNRSAKVKPGHFKWFSEGVTSYYESITLYRAGLIDLDALVSRFNGNLRKYWENPYRESATVSVMEANYWSDSNYEQIAYQGGPLRALLIDARIQQLTAGQKSLDTLMRKLANEARRSTEFDGFVNDDIANRLQELTGQSWLEFFDAYISGVDDLPLNEHLPSIGLSYQMREQKTFELGFKFATLDPDVGNVVTSVVPNGPADKAGIRVGDELHSYGFVRGNPDYEAEFTIVRGAQSTNVKYLPAKLVSIPVIEVVERERAGKFFDGVTH